MTNYGAPSAFLLVGGRDISSDTFTLDETVEDMLEQTNGLFTSWEEHKPVGIAKILLEASGGLYDDETDGIVSALQAKGETKQLVGYGLHGAAHGADVVMLDGAFAATWKRIAARDGLTKAHALYKITGDYKRGRLLHNFRTAETTASGNTEATSVDQSTAQRLATVEITSSSVANPTVITTVTPHGLITGDVIIISSHAGSTPSINGQHTVTVTGASTFTIPVNVTVGGTGGTFIKVTSTNGYADLHVPALVLGGYTNVTIKVRHSADNITFSDLATFTVVTAVGAERVTIAGQIQRYTAISWLFNGAGSGQSIIPYVTLNRAA